MGTKGPSILGIIPSVAVAIKIDVAADDEGVPLDDHHSTVGQHNLYEHPQTNFLLSNFHLDPADVPCESSRVRGFQWTSIGSINQRAVVLLNEHKLLVSFFCEEMILVSISILDWE